MPTRKVTIAPWNSACSCALQWGRVVADAEGAAFAMVAWDSPCFNGAASLPTRKGVASTIGPGVSLPLQWGRVVADAEGTKIQIKHMGDKGKLQWGRVVADAEGSTTLVPWLVRFLALQWGRVVADAEGLVPDPGRGLGAGLQWGRVVADAEGRRIASTADPTRSRFNGAASLPTRKGGPHPDPRERRAVASMGPRRCRRGREVLAEVSPGMFTASMGPRRCRRGRPTLGGGPLPLNPLQWGRVVADAEGCECPSRARRSSDASMGPRRCRRGRYHDIGSTRYAVPGFNGAASLPTRKGVTRRMRGPLALRFNGAASLPTRKVGSYLQGPTPPPASMGPRRCRRGRRAEGGAKHSAHKVLQWGRVVADAEGGATHRHDAARRAASMGPRRCRRGRVRALECGVRNPSASMGPRRCRRGRRTRTGARSRAGRSLQWGRVVADAEGVRARAAQRRRHVASMGPRRCRRGRMYLGGTTVLLAQLLQWGRVVADAEGYAHHRGPTLARPLQWGRVVADAEGGRRAPTRTPRRPRFNGAASLPTRKGARGWDKIAATIASMGPRRCRRGRRPWSRRSR